MEVRRASRVVIGIDGEVVTQLGHQPRRIIRHARRLRRPRGHHGDPGLARGGAHFSRPSRGRIRPGSPIAQQPGHLAGDQARIADSPARGAGHRDPARSRPRACARGARSARRTSLPHAERSGRRIGPESRPERPEHGLEELLHDAPRIVFFARDSAARSITSAYWFATIAHWCSRRTASKTACFSARLFLSSRAIDCMTLARPAIPASGQGTFATIASG